VLRIWRPNHLEPLLHVTIDRAIQRVDEILMATWLPTRIDSLRRRATQRDIATEGEQRRRESHVEPSELLCTILRRSVWLLKRAAQFKNLLLAVVRSFQTMAPCRSQFLQRLIGLPGVASPCPYRRPVTSFVEISYIRPHCGLDGHYRLGCESL